jgi:hypothetical protein
MRARAKSQPEPTPAGSGLQSLAYHHAMIEKNHERPTIEPLLVRVEEAARILSLSRSTIYEMTVGPTPTNEIAGLTIRAARSARSIDALGSLRPTTCLPVSPTPKITTPPKRMLAMPQMRSASSAGPGALILNSTVLVSPPAMSSHSVSSVMMTLTDTGGRLRTSTEAQMFVN